MVSSFNYAGFSGGIGSYINNYDASLLNHFNPRRIGPELNLFAGRQRKRVGWQIGVTYRDVRHFTLGKLYDPNPAEQKNIPTRADLLKQPIGLFPSDGAVHRT